MTFHTSRRFFCILFPLLLSACTALPPPDLSVTPPEPSPSLPPSPTIVWFPPSATPSPQIFPTQAPTPEKKPGIGNVILTDDFSLPDEWTLAASNEGSAAISRNLLTLAVQPGIYMVSLRKDEILANFYAEITARPSLCRGQDEYGLLVRANAVAYYRFVLLCDGTERAERASTRSRDLLQPAMPSGDVPPGSPGEVRIGIWAYGPDLHFFLNGRYQFSITDRNYASGTLGVFAHSVGDTPVTVTFSDLVVYALTYQPPASPTATP